MEVSLVADLVCEPECLDSRQKHFGPTSQAVLNSFLLRLLSLPYQGDLRSLPYLGKTVLANQSSVLKHCHQKILGVKTERKREGSSASLVARHNARKSIESTAIAPLCSSFSYKRTYP